MARSSLGSRDYLVQARGGAGASPGVILWAGRSFSILQTRKLKLRELHCLPTLVSELGSKPTALIPGPVFSLRCQAA